MAATDSPLTPRQLEVLEFMARGLTNREIGNALGISAGTVKNHLAAIFTALDVTNRTEAAMALNELQAAQQPIEEETAVPGFGGRPVIAILPFDDFGGSASDRLFADGLVEDLTSGLAAWRWFPVIARTTTFALRERSMDAVAVGEHLGARYVMEGSCRQAGGQVRIQTQLIDASSGQHVFAERYDRAVHDVFAVQDEIVESIVGALEPLLLRVDGMRVMRQAAHEMDAWTSFQRGMVHFHRLSGPDLERAIELFEEAVRQEPTFAPAHAAMAQAEYALALHIVGHSHTQAATDEEKATALDKAVGCFGRAAESGTRATQLDPLDAQGWIGMGAGVGMLGDGPRALAAFERAIELNPSSASGAFALGNALSMDDARWQEGLPFLARALRLSPHDPYRHHMEGAIAGAHFRREEYETAIEWAWRAVEHHVDGSFGYRPLIAASLGYLGRLEEAREEIRLLREATPDWNLQLSRLIGAPGMVERFKHGLALAGWDVPDGPVSDS